ncbi:MAG: DUF1192 domain-containing protein [Caulobacteraceae bacterium]
MIEDPALPRTGRGAALLDLAREDLDLHAVEDLKERIDSLEAEIARTRKAMERKQAGRAAADALFSKG